MSPRSLALGLVLLLGLPGAASAIEVHAHRGGSGPAPENSLPAFQAAIALGVDALEMDLQLTRDGVLVVHHDATLERSRCRAASAGIVGSTRIDQLSADELEGIRCRGESIPRFEEVLSLVKRARSPVRLTVELKMNGGGGESRRAKLAWRALAALEAAGLSDRTLIQSFDRELLALIADMEPEQALGLLTREPRRVLADLDGIDALLPRADRLSSELVRDCHERGVRVLTWTVNETSELATLVRWGVDGVITDRPGQLLKALGRRPVEPSPRSAGASHAAMTATATVAAPVRPAPASPAPVTRSQVDPPAYALRDVRRAVVMPFTSRGNVDTFCTSLFERAARDRKRYDFPEIVEVYRLPFPVVDGRPLQLRSRLDTMLRVARENGAEAIVVGEGNWYGPFGNRWRMEMRLIEVNRGRVLWSAVGKSGPSFSGPDAKDEVVRDCLRDFREGRGRS
jgi:glycerophosphoryl diester phosphodiesterase